MPAGIVVLLGFNVFLVVLALVDVLGLAVVGSRDPLVTVVERRVLGREVVAVALGAGLDEVAATGGQRAGAGGELGGHGGVLADPVGQRVLAVLDDGLAGLVAVVGRPGLAGRHGRVVNQLQQMLAVAGNDGDLFAVLAQGVKVVAVGRLDLLARDVGQLGLGDERLGLGTDELLLENDNLGRVWLLVLEAGDFVGNLLLPCLLSAEVAGRLRWGSGSRSLLGCTDASMLRMLLMVTRYWS